MKHVITALVRNEPGVLARIIGVVSGRGYNIESVNGAPTDEPNESRLTITVPGDDRVLEQVTKNLNKLIDVIKVTDLTEKRFVQREMVLVEVAAPSHRRPEVVGLANLFEAKVISVQPKSLTVQMVGEQEKVNDFLKLVRPFGIIDLSRSGVVAVAKGD
jgi:acetolactate synthase I/III small subunit